MERVINFLIANIAMTIVYVIAGLLTINLSVLPSGATPLWAPSGIALAAVLIWGYRLLPGVFIGDSIIAIYYASMGLPHPFIMGGLFGFQAAFQAGLGRYLLIRCGVWPSALVTGWAIFQFFVIAALLSTLLPALLVIGVQFYLSMLDLSTWFESLLIWWIGSGLGILTMTPVVLVLFAKPTQQWLERLFTVAMPLFALFVILILTLHYAQDNEREKLTHHFEDNAKVAHLLTDRQVNLYQASLKNMRAFFQNSVAVSEQEFKDYLKDIANGHGESPLYRFGWAERVMLGQKQAYEIYANTAITEWNAAGGKVVPAKVRSEYYPVQYIQHSSDGNDHLLQGVWQKKGLDLCTSVLTSRRCQLITNNAKVTIQRSRLDAGKPIAEQQFLYAMPVLNKGDQVTGIVFRVFEYQALVDDFLMSSVKQWLELEVVDPRTGRVLFSSLADQNETFDRSKLSVSYSLGIMNEHWVFHYYPSSYLLENYAAWQSYGIMMTAFLMITLIATLLMILTGRAQVVEAEVKEKTKEIQLNTQLLLESESKYRCLVENIQGAYLLYRYGLDGIYSYISPSVSEILGYDQADFLTRYDEHWADTPQNERARQFVRLALDGKAVDYEVDTVAKNGALLSFSIHEHPVFDDKGKVQHVEGIAQDITESKKIRLNLEKLSLAMRHNPNAVLITDRDGNIEYVNAKFTSMTGYSANDEIGKWPDAMQVESADSDVYSDLWQTLLSGDEWHGEIQNRKKNGDVYWVKEVIAPMLDDVGNVTHFIVTQEDVTEERALSAQTSYQASHDLLTGLMNRHEFEKRLDRALVSAKRDFVEHTLCYLDLDRFKVVNDTCGHIAGDELLRQIGAMMAANTRSRDTLARLGGDEFVLLMEHCSIEQAHQASELIIDLFRNFRFHWEEHVFTVGVSIGLAIIDQHIKDNEEAIKNADVACYDAKDNGRNQIKVYTEDHERLQKRRGDIQWSTEISNALDNDRLLLYAQPIVALQNEDACEGYEILLRMKMEDGRIVPPGAFLPAAERYNSATRIDRWVVNHTLQWLSEHRSLLPQIGRISINLSGQSLDDEAMTEYIIREFERGEIPADKVKFEITETAAIANLQDATQFISRLKRFGCRFALDDFGSGLSSFAYLKNLDVDTLKIDGMFIKDMLNDKLDYEMVKSINDIGHVMGLETVAEFVESDAILDKIRAIGIDYAQGYSLGKPVPIETLVVDGQLTREKLKPH